MAEEKDFHCSPLLYRRSKEGRGNGKKGNRYLDPPRVRVMYAPVD